MVEKPPWVWHDFKIRWSPDDVAESTTLPMEQFPTTRGTGIKRRQPTACSKNGVVQTN